ncbi:MULTISPECIES: type II toxin-antitoxin system HicB family antitoxin [Lactobacillus]|uniref:HicB family protein n=1 Tax=Lactobacillus xujianguonis TaxID=2495899 RepID=A0A437SX98_9LACO|nr:MULTISPECIES: type II toxin-antitoxin system HicB family antitoxin [Lactobacillus]RVU71480.1 HicB family protein [Lactobacillus xujianguonis]RVU73703.1 HicB family protein [Lactobacillus xujianguonis]
MRRAVYPAVFDDSKNDEKDYYSIDFPDVPGAFSEGHGLADSLYNAEQTLGLALYDIPDNKLPKPTPIATVEKFCKVHYPNAKVYPVAADLDEAAKEVVPVMVRKNTRIPGDIAVRAEKAGINFSKTLTKSLEK